MEDWITIISVGLPLDAQLIKAQLDLHEIEAEILDEMTTDIAPFYSQAMGGIRIQVQKKNFQAATELLHHLGHLKNETRKINPFFTAFITFSEKIPLLNKLRIELRLLLIITAILAIFIVPIVLLNQPKLVDKISGKNWCVTEVYYQNNEILVDDTYGGLYLNNCNTSLEFDINGSVNMSIYKGLTPPISWGETDDGLFLIVNKNNPRWPGKPYFEGEYRIKIEGKRLELWSKTIYIVCYENSPNFINF